MTLRSTTTALAASLLTSACVIVPVTVENFDPDCRLVTHHMELKANQIGPFQTCGGGNCIALLVSLGVTAASAVVSGSIVVVGNAVYWAEERADCEAPAKASAPVAASS